MQDIAKELDNATQAFSFDKKMIQILDLCMAPGVFFFFFFFSLTPIVFMKGKKGVI